MKIVVAHSKIEGRGIFARVPIRRGKTVCVIKGTLHHRKNENLQQVFAHPDWIGFANHWWIDPIPPFKYLNHSCDPNVGIKGRVTIVAMRDIKPGEEIVIDYSTIEADPRWVLVRGIACRCGTSRCRGTIRSIEFLPEKVFNRYMPYIPTRLQSFYRSHVKRNQPNDR